MERQADLLGSEVPKRHLHGLTEGEAEGALIAAARAA